jgi:phosphoserine phosphatase
MKKNRSLSAKMYVKAKKDGILSLITTATRHVYSNYLREHLLTHERTVSYSGIESPYNASIFDRFVPKYPLPEDNPTYESADIDAVRKHSQAGDDVVIVGAGKEITPAVAGNSVGKQGQVIAYEASADRISDKENGTT